MAAPDAISTHPRDEVIAAIIKIDAEQLTAEEYRYVAEIVAGRQGCNMLVFGVGNDSGLWLLANGEGRTVFLESSRLWGELVSWRHEEIDVRMVRYGTRMSDWLELLDGNPTDLALRVPEDVADGRWDVIFVDGPAAHSDSSPGRMKSIYSAAVLARRSPGTDVIVHDCDRQVERAYCDRFLGRMLLVREFQRTRHYRST